MKKLRGLVFFLFFYECVLSSSTTNLITEAGKKTSLACGGVSQGDMLWNKDGSLVIKYMRGQRFQNNAIKDVKRFNVPDQSTCTLDVDDVQLTDSGTYACQRDKTIICTVKLFVFEVSPTPSRNLITSEDLLLKVNLSPAQVPGLQVQWMRGARDLGQTMSIQFWNITLEHSDNYQCLIKMEGGTEASGSAKIEVKGISSPSSEIVYIPKTKSMTLPWKFNFNVRSMPTLTGVKVVEGSVTYQSQVMKQLDIVHGTVCWPDDCTTKAAADMNNLDIHLSNPKIGDYKMEIVLEVEGRRKRLSRDVCVANLTVFSDEDPSVESKVTLLCEINCLHKNERLCWQHKSLTPDICGASGEKTLIKEVTVSSDTAGNWTCYVDVNGATAISTNVTLVLLMGLDALLDTSGYLLWVIIGVGILIFLLLVMIVVVAVARSRRRRRARKRAWLLQNIHQKRRCKCEGFPPQQQPVNFAANGGTDRYV